MVKRFRLLLWLILALLCIPVHGRTILPEEAQKAAKNFFGESAFENKSLKIKGLRSNIEGSSERPFYIFNSTSPGNGFVIVSGDDRMPQILGYSKEGLIQIIFPRNFSRYLKVLPKIFAISLV